MVAALWKHGPQMLSTMEKKGVDWPLLNPLPKYHPSWPI